MAKNKHDITSDKIKQELEKQGIKISSRIVKWHLNKSSGKYLKEISKPLLSEKHQAKQLQ